MENHHFVWENSLQMVIFNSYVKLPDAKSTVYPMIKSQWFQVCSTLLSLYSVLIRSPFSHPVLKRQGISHAMVSQYDWNGLSLICYSRCFTVSTYTSMHSMAAKVGITRVCFGIGFKDSTSLWVPGLGHHARMPSRPPPLPAPDLIQPTLWSLLTKKKSIPEDNVASESLKYIICYYKQIHRYI